MIKAIVGIILVLATSDLNSAPTVSAASVGAASRPANIASQPNVTTSISSTQKPLMIKSTADYYGKSTPFQLNLLDPSSTVPWFAFWWYSLFGINHHDKKDFECDP